MSLLGCPNELLLRILSDLTPADIINFAVSCKRIHSLAERRLAEHRSLQATYGHFSGDLDASSTQLYAIWGQPRRAADYIRTVQYRETWEYASSRFADDYGHQILSASPYLRYDVSVLFLLQDAMRQSSIYWEQSAGHARLGILISILPNLTCLDLEKSQDSECFWPAIVHIILDANSNAKFNGNTDGYPAL